MRATVSALRQLHLRELRTHPLRTTIAVAAVGAGVAMLLAILIVVRSTITSFENQAATLGGLAPLQVVGPTPAGGVDLADVATIERVDGVAAAAPVVRGLRTVERPGPEGVRFGEDVLVIGTTTDVATAFSVGEDALRAGFVVAPALGSLELAGAALRTDVGPLAFDDLTLTVDERLAAAGPRVALTTLTDAQRYLGRNGAVDAVYVVPRDDIDAAVVAERLEDALPPGLDVQSTTDLPPELSQVLAIIVPLFALMGLFSVAIGAVLVANTVSLSLEERRVQLAVVTSLGGSSRLVIAGCLLQSAVIGACAGLLGAGLGTLAAYPLTAAVNQWTLGMAGIHVAAVPSQAPLAVAASFGVLVAMVAAARPAVRATRADVAAELSLRNRREESRTPMLGLRALRALAIGIAAVGVTIVGGWNGSLERWQPAAAWLGLLASLLALAYAMGRVGAVAASGVLRRTDLTIPPVRLAFANLVREPGRTGIMVLAAAAAVGVGYLSASFTAQARAGIIDMAAQYQGTGLSVTIGPTDEAELVMSRPSPDVVAAVEDHPLVGESRRFGSILTSGDGSAIEVLALDGDLSGLPLYAGTADADRFAAGAGLIGAALARDQDVRPGGTVGLPSREGGVEVPVQGIWADGRSVGRVVTLPFDTVERTYGSVPIDGLYVTPAAGVSAPELATALRRDIGDPALRVETAAENAARTVRLVEARLAPFKVLQAGLTALAFVSVISTLILAGTQRRRELGLLAASGMAPRSVFAMVLAEAGAVGLIATLVSLPLGTLQSVAFQAVIPLILGWENPLRFDLWAWLLYGGLTTIVVVVGAIIPAWFASRADVIDALAYE